MFSIERRHCVLRLTNELHGHSRTLENIAVADDAERSD